MIGKYLIMVGIYIVCFFFLIIGVIGVLLIRIGQILVAPMIWILINVDDLENAFGRYMSTTTQDEEYEDREMRLERTKRPPQKRSGYVYVIDGKNGLYKIGRTSSPQSRLRTLELSSPHGVDLEILFYTDDMNGIEKQLHDLFADKREHGEWFRLEFSDIQYIYSLGETHDGN